MAVTGIDLYPKMTCMKSKKKLFGKLQQNQLKE